MEKQDAIEAEISARFRLPAPTLLTSLGKSSPMTFSRLRCDQFDHGKTKSAPPEDAYVVQVMLRDLEKARLWIHGHEVAPPTAPTGGIFLFHLESDPVSSFAAPFDTVRIYLSKDTLDEMATAAGIKPPGGLRRPEYGAPDRILYHMAASLTPFFERGASGRQLLLDHLALAVHAHLVGAYGGAPLDARANQGGLSPWQERRAKEFIEANLHRDATLTEIAEQCGLSTSHFARAFRNTTGRPPHRWLNERRVETAKRLLLDQGLSLAAIAASCGFSDPSHFSRVFSNTTGETPGSWRRSRRL
jgi:AraC-like DNA-binding protein